jgi:hypothetical protein
MKRESYHPTPIESDVTPESCGSVVAKIVRIRDGGVSLIVRK